MHQETRPARRVERERLAGDLPVAVVLMDHSVAPVAAHPAVALTGGVDDLFVRPEQHVRPVGGVDRDHGVTDGGVSFEGHGVHQAVVRAARRAPRVDGTHRGHVRVDHVQVAGAVGLDARVPGVVHVHPGGQEEGCRQGAGAHVGEQGEQQ